jgi:hypothetical protein
MLRRNTIAHAARGEIARSRAKGRAMEQVRSDRYRQSAKVAAWVLGFGLVIAGCAADGELGAAYRVGADCESGACDDGVCVETSSSSTSSAGGAGGEGGGSTTSSGGAGGGGEGGDTPGLCQPNEDGTITRGEYPVAVGISAKFMAALDVSWSTAGSMVGGTRTWDMSEALAGDHLLLLETRALVGTWFEESFPGASYAIRLSDESQLLGVFEVTDDAVLLRGVVSPTDGVSRTELEYDPPVVVLSFPLTEGKTWSTTSTVTGLATGIYSIYTEAYDSVVDARGDATTPFSTFDVLRVRTVLTRTVGVIPTVTRSFAFVTECFGTVATLSSQPGESSVEFSNVAEIKRLTP